MSTKDICINADRISYSYFQPQRRPGLTGWFRYLTRPHRIEIRALENVSFRLRYGEVTGLLGPNGAGKSTFVKILCGLLRPTAGELNVLGATPRFRSMEFLSRLAVVFGHKCSLWWDLPAYRSLDNIAALYGYRAHELKEDREMLIEKLNLRDVLDRPVRQLSLGERVKCELATAMLHRPRLLILDEPTVGLDVNSKLEIRKLIAEFAEQRGVAVLITSHDMGDVENYCKNIMVLRQGRDVFQGSPDEFRNFAGEEELVILRFLEPPAPDPVRKVLRGIDRDSPGAVWVNAPALSLFGDEYPLISSDETNDECQIHIRTYGLRSSEIITRLVEAGVRAEYDLRRPNLETVLANFLSRQDES